MSDPRRAKVLIDPEFSDDDRRRLLFEGVIIVYSQRASIQRLVEHTLAGLDTAFGDVDPLVAHEQLSQRELAELLVEFKPRYIHDPTSKRLVDEMLVDLGCDPEHTYVDLPRLRTSYPIDHLTTGIAYSFGWHRDTWYSAPACQINWWLPLYPLNLAVGLDIFLPAFGVPLDNDSELFSYYRFNAQRHNILDASAKLDTRTHPSLTQPLPDGEVLRAQPPVGGVIVFCGDQLHASVPNRTTRARYSVDFRTVHHSDVVAHRGGPNLDSHSRGTNLRDFLRCYDGEQLADELVTSYDDSTLLADEILRFEPVFDDASQQVSDPQQQS